MPTQINLPANDEHVLSVPSRHREQHIEAPFQTHAVIGHFDGAQDQPQFSDSLALPASDASVVESPSKTLEELEVKPVETSIDDAPLDLKLQRPISSGSISIKEKFSFAPPQQPNFQMRRCKAPQQISHAEGRVQSFQESSSPETPTGETDHQTIERLNGQSLRSPLKSNHYPLPNASTTRPAQTRDRSPHWQAEQDSAVQGKGNANSKSQRCNLTQSQSSMPAPPVKTTLSGTGVEAQCQFNLMPLEDAKGTGLLVSTERADPTDSTAPSDIPSCDSNCSAVLPDPGGLCQKSMQVLTTSEDGEASFLGDMAKLQMVSRKCREKKRLPSYLQASNGTTTSETAPHQPQTPNPLHVQDSPRIQKASMAEVKSSAAADSHAILQVFSKTQSKPAAPGGGAGPTEEDLVFLLMRKQRERKESNNEQDERCRQLEEENHQLTLKNRGHEKKLIGNMKVMEGLKERFNRLKKFAEGIGKDYDVLRAEARRIKEMWQDAAREKDVILHELKEARAASSTASAILSNVTPRISQLREIIGPLQQSLDEAKQRLDGEDRGLRVERARNKRLETYLIRVASTQNRYSCAIQEEQKEMLQKLQAVTTKVDALNKARESVSETMALNDCLEILHALEKANHASSAELIKVGNAVNNLQSLHVHQSETMKAVQATNDNQARLENLLETHLTKLLESFQVQTTDVEQLATLRENNAQLKEQVKSSRFMMDEISDSRVAAETREATLRQSNEKLIAELIERWDRIKDAAKPAASIDLFTKISTKCMEYAASNRDLEQKTREIEAIASKLQGAEAERDSIQSKLAGAEKHSVELIGVKEQLASVVQERNDLKSREVETAQKLTKAEEQIKEAASIRSDLRQEVDRLKEVEREHEKSIENSKTMEEKMKMLQEEAARLRHLERDSREKFDRVIQLESEMAAAQGLANEAKWLEEERTKKDTRISELKKRLKNTEQIAQKLEQMGKESLQKDQEIANLQGILAKVKTLTRQAGEAQREEGQALPQNIKASQDAILALRDLLKPQQGSGVDQGHPENSPTFSLALQPGCRANRHGRAGFETSAVTAAETIIEEFQHKEQPEAAETLAGQVDVNEQNVNPAAANTQDANYVPDSQPFFGATVDEAEDNFQSILNSSSILIDIGDISSPPFYTQSRSANFGDKAAKATEGDDGPAMSDDQLPPKKDRLAKDKKPGSASKSSANAAGRTSSNLTPSSSHGEPMLLEQVEQLGEEESLPATTFDQDQIQHSSDLGELDDCSARVRSTNGTEKDRSTSTDLDCRSSRIHVSPQGNNPSPQGLRSGHQRESRNVTALLERTASEINSQATPKTGILKDHHRPNSAAKRHLPPEADAPTSSQESFKRLKRDLSALEVKRPSQKKYSSVRGRSSPGKNAARLNHPNLPIGLRKGSVIGRSPPDQVPSKESGRKTRKGSKNGRHSALFGQGAN